jgi:hypothetical protein
MNKSTLLLPILATAASAFACTVVGLPPAAGATSWTPPAEPALVDVATTACPATPDPGRVTCLAESAPVSDATARQAGSEDAIVRAGGDPDDASPQLPRNKSGSYTPRDLASLYQVPAGVAPSATIGIVDVGSDPNTRAQLNYYRSYFGLPACTTANGCFREVAQDGSNHLPAANSNWVTEIALDVQAVSAMCPTCHILLVDAATPSVVDMAKATQTATTMGAAYVSLSFGSAESPSTAALRNPYYSDPDVTYVAAAGDDGYQGTALFPASAPNVVAAGGTSAKLVNGTWRQTAWSGSGSGCSSVNARSSEQSTSSPANACNGKRAVSDLAALADPDTGMLFYQGGQWWNAGGTSLAAPILASLYALAGNHTNPLSVYRAASGSIVDITSGSTGSCAKARLCTAAAGWDGPTGLGTPAGLSGLANGARLPTYASSTEGSLAGGVGYPASFVYRLADASTGMPVGGAHALLQVRDKHGFRTVRSVVTGSNGKAAFTARPRKPTTYRVVFAGDHAHRASTSNKLSIDRFRPTANVRRLHGRLRAVVRAPWGAALRRTTVRLQAWHHGRWHPVRTVRTDRHGAATIRVTRGVTYRLVYGGGSWQLARTTPLTAR